MPKITSNLDKGTHTKFTRNFLFSKSHLWELKQSN